MIEHRSHTYGVVGEFVTEHELIHAAEKAREAGYHHFETYAPFPVEGLSEAMGLKRNKVPLITLIGGLCGGLGGFFFQYWCNVYSYPLNIAGRPLNSWPAFIPVTFELTVLGASLSAVFGMLALNGLPQPHHPLFNVERFSKHATTDRFFLCIEARDKKFDLADSSRFLQGLKAQHVTEVVDD
jgi:Alternative complex III, ActD subunit